MLPEEPRLSPRGGPTEPVRHVHLEISLLQLAQRFFIPMLKRNQRELRQIAFIIEMEFQTSRCGALELIDLLLA